MLRSIFFRLPVIKQIHERSLKRTATNHLTVAMHDLTVDLPDVQDIGSLEELAQLIKAGLAGRGIEVGSVQLFKESYRCPRCNSTFDTIEGDDGLGKHLEVVHSITISRGGKE